MWAGVRGLVGEGLGVRVLYSKSGTKSPIGIAEIAADFAVDLSCSLLPCYYGERGLGR